MGEGEREREFIEGGGMRVRRGQLVFVDICNDTAECHVCALLFFCVSFFSEKNILVCGRTCISR